MSPHPDYDKCAACGHWRRWHTTDGSRPAGGLSVCREFRPLGEPVSEAS